jgi:hypothetical protein
MGWLAIKIVMTDPFGAGGGGFAIGAIGGGWA